MILLSISLILLLNLVACTKKNDSSNSDSKTTDSQDNAANNTEDKDAETTKSDQAQDDTKQANKNVNDTSINLMADVKAQEIQPDSDMQKADFMQKFAVEMLQNLAKDSDENILFSLYQSIML